jgi:hypothetical protein
MNLVTLKYVQQLYPAQSCGTTPTPQIHHQAKAATGTKRDHFTRFPRLSVKNHGFETLLLFHWGKQCHTQF